MADSAPAKRKWLILAGIFALYFGIACLITWPLITELGSLLVGRTTDAMVHYWNGWWFQQALAAGQSPFQTALLNYPEGVSLVTHNFALLNIMPWLLLEPIIGGIPAYNLIILVTLALCGWAMYLLAYELLLHRQAAFIAGLVYMAWPFRLSQLDHPNLIATYWVPIFFLFLIRTLRRGRWLDALWAGIALALVGYTRWQILIPVAFMIMIYLLATIKQWLPHWRETLPRLILTGGVALLALLPPALMLAREQMNSDFSADVIYAQDEASMSTDLLAYLTPSKRHFTLNEITKPLVDNYYPDRTPGRRYPTYIGITVLILAAVGLIKRWRDSWVWLLMALLLIGLAAGMVLRINGQMVTAVPTLYKLLSPIQIARLMRIPERYVIFLALPMGMLAAYGWQVLISSRRLSRWSLPLTLLLSLAILYEYQSMPLQSQYTDYDKTVFEMLAQESSDSAILNIPLRYRFSKEYLFEQTFHERPILQGHVSREPDNLYDFIEESEFLSGLPDLTVDPGYLMARLNEAGVEHVVLSKYLLEDATWRLWRRHIPYEPYYNDDRYLVYKTRPQFGIDIGEPDAIDYELGIIDKSLNIYCSDDQITAAIPITWAKTNPQSRSYLLALTAVSSVTGEEIKTPSEHLIEDWPTYNWPGGTVTQQAYTISMPRAGAPYRITGETLDSEYYQPLGRRFDISNAAGDGCDIDAGSAATANVKFGDKLKLLSYQTEQDGDELAVNLYWLAEERPGSAYKFFIHVYDPLTGEVVAQIDTMPHNWQLPTTDWRSGDIVADEIRLSLAGIPAGQYAAALGVYEEASGERLPITIDNIALQVSEDGRLILPDQIQIP